MDNKIKQFIRDLYKSLHLPYNKSDYVGYLKTDTEYKAVQDNCMIHIDHEFKSYRIEPFKSIKRG